MAANHTRSFLFCRTMKKLHPFYYSTELPNHFGTDSCPRDHFYTLVEKDESPFSTIQVCAISPISSTISEAA